MKAAAKKTSESKRRRTKPANPPHYVSIHQDAKGRWVVKPRITKHVLGTQKIVFQTPDKKHRIEVRFPDGVARPEEIRVPGVVQVIEQPPEGEHAYALLVDGKPVETIRSAPGIIIDRQRTKPLIAKHPIHIKKDKNDNWRVVEHLEPNVHAKETIEWTTDPPYHTIQIIFRDGVTNPANFFSPPPTTVIDNPTPGTHFYEVLVDNVPIESGSAPGIIIG